MSNRTDLAMELISSHSTLELGELISRTDVRIDAATAKKIKKPQGDYCTIESPIVARGLSGDYDRLTDAIAGAIKEFVGGAKNILAVGLGNPNLTADALGSKVFGELIITRHISEEFGQPKGIRTVSGFCPNVMGITGIESFDIIKGVTDKVKPDLVIVIDSLASATVSRLASAFQISSSGITPGSGVSNHRKRLDKASLGVRVISIGVPMVVYASTIIADALSHRYGREELLSNIDEDLTDLIVTPKDIDMLVAECGKVIAMSINRAIGTEVKT